MNIFNRIFTVVFLLSLVAGCSWLDDPKENPDPVDKYLVSFEKHKSYTTEYLTALVQFASVTFPDVQTELQKLAEQIEHPVTVYTLSYTTRFNGKNVVASGLVAIPDTKAIEFPLLSYQNGTNTLHSQAPSVNPDSELFVLLETVAATGFVVILPDYLGFGASDDMYHPYLHKVSTVQTVTDMLRAVKELCTNHLETELNDDLFLAGYSQGGWATMQVQKAIEQDYASEFDLKASACGAGPYDLNYINRYILESDTYPMPYFIGYIFNTYFNLGLEANLASEIFNPPYDSRIMTLYDGTKSGEEINAQLTTKISELFTENFITGAYTDEKYTPLVNSLSENSVEAWKTTTKTLILHGTDDGFVPPMGSNKIVQEFRSKGVGTEMVTLMSIPGATHTTGIISSGIASMNWLIEIRNAKQVFAVRN